MSNVLTLLNTIRANANAMYQERVPEATRTNLEKIGELLISQDTLKNQFLNALIDKILFQEISNRQFTNPLSVLKKGHQPFGVTEEIFTNPIKGEAFDGTETGAAKLLKYSMPDTKVMYHKMNRQDMYPVTISNAQLRKAFTGEGALTAFINSVLTALYSGDEMDEFMLMKNTIASAIAGGKLITVPVSYDGEEATCKELVKAVKTASKQMTFPSKDFNGYNLLNKANIEAGTQTSITTWTPAANQVFLIRADVDVATDVEVLAKAFNMEKTEFLKRKIVVDSFGNEKALCMICDEALFKFKDDEYTTKTFDNGRSLTTNYFLHHWQTLSLSLFANAIVFEQE